MLKLDDATMQMLASVSLFSFLKDQPQLLMRISQDLKLSQYAPGEDIITEGDKGDQLFILREGTVSIEKRTLANENYTLVRLTSKPEATIFFGELALLDADSRSATVKAMTACSCLTLDRASFLSLGNHIPEVGLEITRRLGLILAQRLRKANSDVIVLFEALVNEIEQGTKI